ncbi:TRNAU1AP [Bugula neritina]|uniref:tRNAU1AP n=1 Tax=Bugula neritina TaxID=10212 RepID=A0A7J7KS61_BUGNE|nr:TRNAU1AP [Bugula neritina]
MDIANRDARRSATLWMGDLEPYMDNNFLVHAFREALMRTDNIIRDIKAPLNKMTGKIPGSGSSIVRFANW